MMWWMVFYSTRQVQQVLLSSIFKSCFLIYLVEIACSWIAATVDSVDLFRVEYFNHWLGRSLSTWGCSSYFSNYPCLFFLLCSTSSLLMCADLMLNFRGNFLVAVNCWISWPLSLQYYCAFWWIDFFPWVTCQFVVSFRDCSLEFK